MSKTRTSVIENVPPEYLHLKAKFPLGIAQIKPIYVPYDKTVFLEKPTKEQMMDPENYRKALSSSIIVEMARSRGTHAVTGQPDIKPQIYDVIIWPGEPLTNNCGQLSSDFKDNPWAIIEVLLNHDGYGKLFKLVKPATVVMERIATALENPTVQRQVAERKQEMKGSGKRLQAIDRLNPHKEVAAANRPLPSIGRPGKPAKLEEEDEDNDALDLVPEVDMEAIGVEEEESEA